MRLATRCPSCATLFLVVPDQLRVSDGWVRCGRCANVFNAEEDLLDVETGASVQLDLRPPELAKPPAPAPAPHWAAGPQTSAAAADGDPPNDELPPNPAPAVQHYDDPLDAPVDHEWSRPPERSERPEPADRLQRRAPDPSTRRGHDLAGPHDHDLPEQLLRAPSVPDHLPTPAAGPGAKQALPDRPTRPAPAAGATSPWNLAPARGPVPPAPPAAPDQDGRFERADGDLAPAGQVPQRDDIPKALGDAAAAPDPVTAGPDAGADEPRADPGAGPDAEPGEHRDPWPDTRITLGRTPDGAAELRPGAEAEHESELDLDAPLNPPRRPDFGPSEAGAPSFLRQADRAARWQQSRWRTGFMVLALLLGGLLGAQMALLWRDPLAARVPSLSPLLRAACAPLGCSLQPLRRIELLAVDSSGLNRIEEQPGPEGYRYRFSVLLHNRAETALMAPAMELTLSDSRGDVVIRRVLQMADFGPLPQAIPAGQELPLRLLLATGDRRIEGYTVELFYP